MILMVRIFVVGLLFVAASFQGAIADQLPTQDQLLNAETSSDWLYVNHDYAGTRYVKLGAINKDNVARLAPICAHDAGDDGPFYTAPIVHAGVLYFTARLATIAIDAASCAVKWRHDWKPRKRIVWPQNRGVAIASGLVVRGTTDGFLIALDAETGAERWVREIASAAKGETLTMAPVIFDDLVIIGPAGSEHAIKGWVGAFRLGDGAPVWRFNTVPRAGEPGADTWRMKPDVVAGGGGVWTPFSIDAETGSLYVAVTNPAPDFLGEARPGDNLYTNSMVVLDVHTGKLKWYRQMVPHDVHDWDLTQVSPLFSTRIDGQQRKLVATAGKDGMLRVFDRNRRNKVYETAVTKRENVDQPISEEGTHACPGVFGGVQWSAPAYNPNLNALFVPSVEWCGIFTRAQEAIYVKGHLYMGGRYMPDSKWKGWLTAIDASTGTIRWRYESKRPMLAAATTTASDLVFTGELTGDFLALDGQTGAVLFRHNLDGAIAGGIVTYMVEDRQYVAVASGSTTGYWSGPYATAKITLFAVK